MTIDDVTARLLLCAEGPVPGLEWSTEPGLDAVAVGRADLRALLDDHARLAARAEVERLTRERDAARSIISDARYLVEQDMADGGAMRATLAGNGLEPGVAAEYQSDLDRLRADLACLAAALAEVREACGDLVGARLVMHVRDGGCVDHAERSDACEVCTEKPRSARGEIEDRFRAVLAATPADLATARDARVRAEALRSAAGAYGREAEPEAEFVRDWLRAEADRIEGR